MGAWQPWASAVNYIMRISQAVYWALQACPRSLFADEFDATPGHDMKPGSEPVGVQNLNPETLRAASSQAQLPSCPRFFGLKPETNSILGEFLRPTNLEPPMLIPCLHKDPVSSANKSADLSNNPGVTETTADEKMKKKLPLECGLLEDDKSYGLKRELKFPHHNPTNEKSPMQDATEGFQTLVDNTTWPEEVCKGFPMADGHTYTWAARKLPITILTLK
ncbi:hypothetical protein DSO57_1006507 [Entomophthora muscae]|uniref:Uncharacterized protein n=1 Tax=Entomophthora muscae TaxID=34485 RepID=A0ACC2S9L9_9FUNG|nr:hypothetical protein DSO57_1006507 [Entomophthora muscae]